MIALAFLAAALTAGTCDTLSAGGVTHCRPMVVAPDTQPRRRRSVVYSEAYGTRLTIHRYGSYAMLPIFGAEYLVGSRLLQQKDDVFSGQRTSPIDPSLRHTHRLIGLSLASLFLVNTTTGLWNLYEARDDPAGKGIRTAHALTMLAAEAGFVLGAELGSRATQNGPSNARQHRNVALGSMALSTAGASIMWFFNRR